MKATIELEKLPEGQGFTAVIAAALVLPVVLTLLSVIYLRSEEERTSLRSIVLATGEYEPYTGKELGLKGLATAVVEATFREMGYQPRYEYMPWNLVSNSVARSEFNDGIRAGFPYSKFGSRSNVFLFSEEPLLEVDFSLFVKATEEPPASLGALKGYRFILQDGYEYPPHIRHAAERSKPVTTNGLAAFALLLESDEPLVLPESTAVGWTLLNRYFPEKKDLVRSVQLSNRVDKIPLYLMASRRNPHNRRMLKLFDQKLRQLKKRGAYKAIVNDTSGRPPLKQVVVLRPMGDRQHIRAKADEGHFVVPTGTRAEVVAWGGLFYPRPTLDATAKAGDAAVKVRLLDGPMAGATVLIDGAAIDFEFVSQR